MIGSIEGMTALLLVGAVFFTVLGMCVGFAWRGAENRDIERQARWRAARAREDAVTSIVYPRALPTGRSDRELT